MCLVLNKIPKHTYKLTQPLITVKRSLTGKNIHQIQWWWKQNNRIPSETHPGGSTEGTGTLKPRRGVTFHEGKWGTT